MKYWIVALLFAWLSLDASFAQDSVMVEEPLPEVVEMPLLDRNQLNREKWYYSIEDAMKADPSQVYRLCLMNKKLKEIPKEVFYFRNLQELNLSENKIKKVPAEIGKLDHLMALNLFKNKLSIIPAELQEMKNLNELYLANNHLVEIPAWIGGFGKLRRLDVSYNRITRLEAESLQRVLPRCNVTHGFERESLQD
jgi:Leucine-rich repeat (LRR) protein